MTDTTDQRQTPAGHDVARASDTTVAPGRSRRRTTGRDRRHLTPGRPRQVKIRYTDDEYTDVAAAAAAAGLTPTGYAGEAALAAARNAAPPSTAPWRRALLELMAARGQVRRFGGSVNQAVRTFNALGHSPEWLDRAVAVTERAVTRLDEAAATVTLVARSDRARHGRPAVTVSDAHETQTSDKHKPVCPMASGPASNDAHSTAANHGRQPAVSGHIRSTDQPAREGSA